LAQKIRGLIFGTFYLRVWRASFPSVEKSASKTTYYRKKRVFLAPDFDGGSNGSGSAAHYYSNVLVNKGRYYI